MLRTFKDLKLWNRLPEDLSVDENRYEKTSNKNDGTINLVSRKKHSLENLSYSVTDIEDRNSELNYKLYNTSIQ